MGSKEKEPKDFSLSEPSRSPVARAKQGKVFWFFFSKKNCFLTYFFSVYRKAGPAPARRRRIRISHGKMATHQLISVIQLRAGQEIEADGIHQHPAALIFQHQVILLRC
jgi:hypothetical protein